MDKFLEILYIILGPIAILADATIAFGDMMVSGFKDFIDDLKHWS